MCSDRTGPSDDVPVIDVDGLGKAYHIYDRPVHRLMQGIFRQRRKLYREFWAIREATFSVSRGETLGIVGRNGSGKSTLLQLIAGTLTATEGSVVVHGRVVALLELGSGFNPDFTGRENVYLNAAILGLSRAEVETRITDILAFADIGEFIDQPIRNYSSGMVMRLAFSVIAHVDADVMIIDEALAVGDAFFTQKCMRFLREFKQRGTLLFVSHDGAAVTALCDRAIWLDQGRLRAQGTAKEVMDRYLEEFISEREGRPAARPNSTAPVTGKKRRDVRADLFDRSQLRNDVGVVSFDPAAAGFGARAAVILDVVLLDEEGRQLNSLMGGESVCLEVTATANEELADPIVGFYLKDRLGQLLFGDNTFLATLEANRRAGPGETIVARFHFEMPRLQQGDYFVTAGVATGSQDNHIVQHWIHEALVLKAQGQGVPVGIIGLPMHDISLETIP